MRKEIFPHSFLGATCPKSVIKVKDIGEMIVLRIIGDGNCQFRAISTILSGHDDDENYKIIRKLAVRAFTDLSNEELEETGVFFHDKKDCVTKKICKKSGVHRGGFLGASVRPYSRLVYSKDDFANEMSKERVWGNEITSQCICKALSTRINLIQEYKGAYKITHRYGSNYDYEVNILYNYDEKHYEALIPKEGNLSERKSFLSDSVVDIGSSSDSDKWSFTFRLTFKAPAGSFYW